MNRSGVLRFVLLGCIWGSSYTFIKVADQGLTPGQLVLARLVLGAAVLLAVVAVSGVEMPAPGPAWAHMTVATIFGMVAPFLLLAWGERSASAAVAGVLVGATPLITLAAATTVLHTEQASRRRIIGLVVGFAGVVLVISPWQGDPGSLVGQLACLGSAVSYAAQTAYIRRFLSPLGIAPVAMAASQLVIATLLQAAVTPLMAWQRPSLSGTIIASIVVLGVVNTGLAYVLYFRLIGDLGATTASAVNYLVPIMAVVIGVVTLGEVVTWNMLAGAGTVLAGFAYAENRLAFTGRLRPRRTTDT